ncbi:hypothetical protein BCR43DRAFT_494945 [Syncephalastrum racemosum]|uniref:Ubiquitin-like domain-containing protein n=1 Tax=Syncephalastrum racemosum TaxID=13706 RepID=A0A1X2H8V6_SYNRA|nr:hypothetical protein BCR43DRAFT_494945 [Syncephalastrum racemosum]
MAAVTSSDLAMAQSILDAANIIIPTGNLADGCYDELGTRYVIPQYCIAEPTNLRQDPEAHRTATNTTMTEDEDDTFKKTPTSSASPLTSQPSPSPVHVPAGDDTLYPITVRLSTAQDLKVHISKHDETVASLRTRIFMMPESNVTVQTHTLRLIYLGRLLSDNEGIVCEEAVTDESKLDHVIVIPEGAIIQALAAKK